MMELCGFAVNKREKESVIPVFVKVSEYLSHINEKKTFEYLQKILWLAFTNGLVYLIIKRCFLLEFVPGKLTIKSVTHFKRCCRTENILGYFPAFALLYLTSYTVSC